MSDKQAGFEPLPELSSEYTAPGIAALCCPECGGTYTHQGRVMVFKRGEDEMAGLTAVVRNEQEVLVTPSVVGNPSPRRDGLTVEFDCEECGCEFSLHIWQHKGQTHLQMTPNGLHRPDDRQ